MSQDGAKVPQWVRPRSLARRIWARLQQRGDVGADRKKLQSITTNLKSDFTRFSSTPTSDSCAYFEGPNQSLKRPSSAKKRHIAAKLLIKPGSRGVRYRFRWWSALTWLKFVALTLQAQTLSKMQVSQANAKLVPGSGKPS